MPIQQNADVSIEIDATAMALLAVEHELRFLQCKQDILNECVLDISAEIRELVRVTKAKVRKIKDKRKKAAMTAAKV